MIRTRRLTHIQRKGIVNAGLLIGTLVCIPAADAQESAPTPPVVGHKPVLKTNPTFRTSIDPEAASTGATMGLSELKFGQTVTAAELGLLDHYHDADGDPESNSLIKWLNKGVIVAEGPTFTPQADKVQSNYLTVKITPKSASGDPDTGNEYTSSVTFIRSAMIDRFIKPTTEDAKATWYEANQSCIDRGLRLPTLSEMSQLIGNEVSQYEYICKIYGWPSGTICGGKGSHDYWTSDMVSEGIYWTVYTAAVSPTNYKRAATQQHNFACIKD